MCGLRWLVGVGLLLTVGAAAQSLQELSDEYGRLRQIRGHFQGGTWNAEVDPWNCRKHQVMAQLGELLGAGQAHQDEVRKWMGEPDEEPTKGTATWALVHPDAQDHLLVYLWRGHHDFLYFTCRQSRVTGARWWMAGE